MSNRNVRECGKCGSNLHTDENCIYQAENIKRKEPTIIKDPPRMWWAGDPRVEKFMPPVAKAIMKYLEWPSKEYTDIYNRAYEAVYAAIKEYAGGETDANKP